MRFELIKDYELEVHYHPGKPNVVADVLSCKAHYNYLPAVPLTGEVQHQSITRLIAIQYHPHTPIEGK
jgi:hypothetical protein